MGIFFILGVQYEAANILLVKCTYKRPYTSPKKT
jgi:hypothetical protein